MPREHRDTATQLRAEYKNLSKKGEGTFSEVIKCQNIYDGTLVAIKHMKGKFNRYLPGFVAP